MSRWTDDILEVEGTKRVGRLLSTPWDLKMSFADLVQAIDDALDELDPEVSAYIGVQIQRIRDERARIHQLLERVEDEYTQLGKALANASQVAA